MPSRRRRRCGLGHVDDAARRRCRLVIAGHRRCSQLCDGIARRVRLSRRGDASGDGVQHDRPRQLGTGRVRRAIRARALRGPAWTGRGRCHDRRRRHRVPAQCPARHGRRRGRRRSPRRALRSAAGPGGPPDAPRRVAAGRHRAGRRLTRCRSPRARCRSCRGQLRLLRYTRPAPAWLARPPARPFAPPDCPGRPSAGPLSNAARPPNDAGGGGGDL